MKNPMAEAANWEARCVTEEEAPHKWNEAWGQMFTSGIPHDYAERIEFLENELKQCSALERPPKYGGSAPSSHGGCKLRQDPLRSTHVVFGRRIGQDMG